MAKTPATAKALDCAPDSEWRADDDLRTLISAEKIKADPARMKAAMQKRDEMKKAITAISKDA